MIPEAAERSKLAELTARWELLSENLASLAELPRLVQQLQAECDELRERVRQLEAERSQLLHAWADEHISEDELARSSQEPGGGSLAELLARLGRQ